jgi:branched-chain amino acid transport system substrate-binding protein
MKRDLLSLLLIVLVVGTMVIGGTKTTQAKTLDIGIATPLTGPPAHLGTNIKNSILLAIDDQNKQGGVTIGGEKYTLNAIIRDTKADGATGRSIAEELVFDKKVKVIAGPFLGDTIGAQTVTEPNKVILFAVTCDIPQTSTPEKPYSFFISGGGYECTINGAAYVQKFYPDLKTVATLNPDLPSLPNWVHTAEALFPKYGLKWLGIEKFSADTKDFMPVISRVLAKKPDIVDTAGTAGDMGGMCALLIKQLRGAGFNGVIMARTVPPVPVMMEVVPERFRTKIITSDILVDSPIVSKEYKAMYQRYIGMFKEPPIDIVGEMYDGVKPFFEFINGQDTMDTTAWMEGFAKSRWQSVWGREGRWVGGPIFGISRMLVWGFWVAEYTNGTPKTKWQAPVPWDLFE